MDPSVPNGLRTSSKKEEKTGSGPLSGSSTSKHKGKEGTLSTSSKKTRQREDQSSPTQGLHLSKKKRGSPESSEETEQKVQQKEGVHEIAKSNGRDYHDSSHEEEDPLGVPTTNSDESTECDSSSSDAPQHVKRDQIRQVPVRAMFFNSRGRTKNPSRFPIKKFKSAQQQELARFRRAAAAGKWGSIHNGHFDWFMFPIEDGSQDGFNVYSADCLELKSDLEWFNGYLEAIELAAKAWGWDVKNAQPCDPMERGMCWTDWDVRLAKIIRSLWIFQQKEYMESMQAFARRIAPTGGLSYGWISLDEVFFMKL